MAFRIDDRWLWLGFGVFLFAAAKGFQYAMTDIVRLTEIEPYQYDFQREEKELPEDTIRLNDLNTLAECPNPNIANAAISLIVSRLLRDKAECKSLVEDLHSKDHETAARANRAAKYLREWPLPPDFQGERLRDLHLPDPDDNDDLAENDFIGTMARLGLDLDEDKDEDEDEDAPPGRLSPVLGVDGNVTYQEFVPSVRNPVAGWTSVPRERPINGDDDNDGEVEARRRRREAVVVYEGEEEVEQAGII